MARSSAASRFALIEQRAAAPFMQNLPAMIVRRAQECPDASHLTIGSQSISFGEARERAALHAGRLAEAGVRRGDRVAIMCGNRIEMIEMIYGCLWLGAIFVPVNTALRDAQLVHALSLSGASILILEGKHVEHLALIADRVKALKVACLDDAMLPAGIRGLTLPKTAHSLPEPTISPGDPAAILFTSGTTGPSKGALCPAAQFYWWAEYQTAAMRVDPVSVIYNALPLFHINALNSVSQSLLTGARCVIGTRFSASGFWLEAAQCGATHSAIIGAMADLMLAQPPNPNDRSHRIHTVLASSVRADTWVAVSQRFGITHRVGGYGSTETNLVFNSDDGWEQQGNMGFVTDGFEASVVDEFDIPVPDGTAGELLLRSRVPHAFALGYWGMHEATVNSWRNLWFHTGDRVIRNDDGRFRFVGRLKESIRRRGENISAWEVEQAILGFSGIAEVAVYGVPSALSDEEVMATLVMKPGLSMDFQALVRYLEPRLARFAIPRYFDVAESLPLTDTGKIRRGALVERGVQASTWDRERSMPSQRRQ
jgi:crotonobetaine/carnitine-CoA ligase